MLVVAGLLVRDIEGVPHALMGLRRPDRLRPSMWEYPGGKVEDGESYTEALRREWREELGLEITHSIQFGGYSFDVEERIVIVLHGVEVRGEPQPLDHAELRWMRPEWAVKHLPMTPGCYLLYPLVVEALARRSSGGRR
jgi:8-oxo-dGTP diphosphatase